MLHHNMTHLYQPDNIIQVRQQGTALINTHSSLLASQEQILAFSSSVLCFFAIATLLYTLYTHTISCVLGLHRVRPYLPPAICSIHTRFTSCLKKTLSSVLVSTKTKKKLYITSSSSALYTKWLLREFSRKSLVFTNTFFMHRAAKDTSLISKLTHFTIYNQQRIATFAVSKEALNNIKTSFGHTG